MGNGCAVKLHVSEQYWGDELGTCVGGERNFQIKMEGTITHSSFDICALTQAVNTAYIITVPNVITGGDDVLNIELAPAQSLAGDLKWELAAIEVHDYSASGDTLSLTNASPSVSKNNSYPNAVVIDPVGLSGAATTTTNPISISGTLNTASLTSGTAEISANGSKIEYTAANGTTTGSVGSIGLTLSDGVDTESVTVNLSLTTLPYVKTTIKYNGSAAANLSGWCWGLITGNDELVASSNFIYGNTCDESTDGSGVLQIDDSRLVTSDIVKMILYYPSSATVGGKNIRDIPFVANKRVK